MRERVWAPGSAAVYDFMLRPGGPDISAEATLLYCSLFSHADDTFTCYPSITRLAAGTKLHRATILRRLEELEGVRLITRLVSHGRANRYQLHQPWNWSPTATSSPQQLVADSNSTSRSQQPQLVADSDTKKPNVYPSKKPTNARQSSTTKQQKAKPFEEDFAALWALYPRKVNKPSAYAKYAARRREGISAEDLATATKHYIATRQGQDHTYTLHAATLWGPERWRDYLTPPEIPQPAPQPQRGRWTEERRSFDEFEEDEA